MDIDAARGIRDETDLPRRMFAPDGNNHNIYVTAVLAGDGIVAVTDRFEGDDFAWAGNRNDQQILDELVADGELIEISTDE
jgi:hypothetical protein